mmetsp:Transcript_114971/g.245513  ORF Transcript_114971/g.245513 Transcript_114971/m.245513 type:complete len:476 (-) Transcript_114971:40-1467(-)
MVSLLALWLHPADLPKGQQELQSSPKRTHRTGLALGRAGRLFLALGTFAGHERRVGASNVGGAGRCSTWFFPPAPPLHATDHNGISLPDVCFNRTGPHHVFVIGDWGGVLLDPSKSSVPVPADKRSPKFPGFARTFVNGVDDVAQLRVASQMKRRAPTSKPDYILNMGDNFYWGGIKTRCGSPAYKHVATGQWGPVFEDIYRGPGIDGLQWLGVLGNHDYGGWKFTSAWDQAIAYTWGGPQSTGRWMTPAQYWKAKVHYSDFSVDYYFVDSNYFSTFPKDVDQEHNLCGFLHNSAPTTCGAQGPTSLENCYPWFQKLWQEQLTWLDVNLARSTADWQIVVTHFPPFWGQDDWKRVSREHGIDLMVTGHQHLQSVWSQGADGNFLNDTAVIISGGGGGITSEGLPDASGEDDMYGFMDLTLSREVITIEAISHGGSLRTTTHVHPRLPDEQARAEAVETTKLRGSGSAASPRAVKA